MTFKKICALIIIIPPAVILIAFIIANRSLVAVNFNIFAALFGKADSSYSFTLPLFIWLFAFLALGAGIACLAMLPRHYSRQRQINALERENARLAAEAAAKMPRHSAENAVQF